MDKIVSTFCCWPPNFLVSLRNCRLRASASLGFKLAIIAVLLAAPSLARAQLPEEKVGEVVPRDVREMYDRGLQYLANTQSEQGNWTDGEQGPGITGLALMAF